MAGLFGLFDFTKEGKGVYADDPPKGPVGLYFSVLGRKFWQIIAVNIMYIILSLPALALSLFTANYVLSMLIPVLNIDTLADIFREAGFVLQEGISFEEFAATQLMTIYAAFAILMTGLGLVVLGPVHAGVTFIFRNYSREEHAFIWMDFKDHAKRNFKQSLLTGLISYLVMVLFVFNVTFYSLPDFITNNYVRTALMTIMIILFVLWCIMQMYIYPMMITFELSIKQMFKNAFLFSILRLPLNILILILSLIIMMIFPLGMLLIGYGFSVLIAFIWYGMLAFSINLLMTNLFVYRGLDKYMIQRLQEPEDGEDEEDEGQEDDELDQDADLKEAMVSGIPGSDTDEKADR